MSIKPSLYELEGVDQNFIKPTIAYFIVSYLFVCPIFRCLFRGKTFGNENVPKSGPLVVVSNHGSHLDPPILGHVLGRPVAFMAKAELFKIPLLGKLISMCGAYPVRRGSSDRQAIRTATELLLMGAATGIFLDGRRQPNGRVNKPMAGAALLAARSQANLLPVAIINTHRALRSGSLFPRLIPIHIYIGKPIPPPNTRKKADLDVTTNLLKETINLMIDQAA